MSRGLLGLLGLLLFAPSPLLAQQGSNFGGARGGSTTSGLFGSRTLGGNLQGGGNSLFGSGTRGSSAGSSATTQQMQGGVLTGNERFMNQNRDVTRNFVGADAGEVRSIGTAGNAQAQNLQGLQNAFSQFRQFNQLQQQFNNLNNAGQAARTPVRIGLTLGFDAPAAVSTRVSSTVAGRLTRLPGVEFVGAPQVSFVGRTAVVQGTVASERDRELVSRLLLLEPGISAVRNELTIARGSAGSGAPRLAPPPGA